MKNIGIQMKDSNNNNVYPNPFPVGAIYMSVDSRNPSKIFGGTWEQIKDRFLLCAGSTYKPGTAGGSATHNHTTGNCTLNVNQIPSHQHMTSNGENGAILNWSNDISGDYWGHKYKEGSFASSGAHALVQLRTSPTGGNQAHNHGNTGSANNMPPYLAVYVWRANCMKKGITLRDEEGNVIYPCPFFPIGSIYMSVNNVNPSSFFGGTWEQIKDRFLLCAGSTYKAGTTGGEANHVLSVEEIPSHRHIGLSWLGDDGSQSITLNGGASGKGYNLQYYGGYVEGQETNIQTRATGGNRAHNNMPPYLAVYVWRRIA